MKVRINIYIIDDHLIVREGLKARFNDEEQYRIVGESNGDVDIPALLKTSPDIVLMDISLGKFSGIELTRMLLSHKKDMKVIILSMHSSHEVVVSAIEAGAMGYLPKSTSKEEMKQAISEVYDGKTYFHSDIANVVISGIMQKKRVQDKNEPCVDCLSKREVQIIELFAKGYTNQEMADKLFISIRTVESHKTHIMQKLEFRSTVEMVTFAIKNKLIELK